MEPVRTDHPPALLLGGTTNALSIARSLGRRGIPVLALNSPDSHVRYSRFARYVAPPAAENVQESWLAWLLGEGRKRWTGGVLLPCADDAVELIAKHRTELARDFVVAEANDEVALAMLEKTRSYELARKAGIPLPGIWELTGRESLLQVIDEVPFPCALKPSVSHEWQRHFSARKLFVAGDKDALVRIFDELHALGVRLMVTEIIPGGDDQFCSYFSYLDENGEPLLHFTKHKLRQYPIHFGIGTYHISDRAEDVKEQGLRFFQRIGLRGMANVEFKRDARDGSLKLIECNPRFSAANELLTRSGIDFALFVYNRLTGRPLPETGGYRTGVRLVRPLEDFAAFRAYRSGGEWTTLGYLCSLLCRRWHTAYASWRDPWPSAVRAFHVVRYQIRKRLLSRPSAATGGK